MKIRIIKESKLLQEQVEIETEEVQNNEDGLEVYFTIDTGKMTVKQQLTIRGGRPGTAFVVFDDQLPIVQKCFPKPPEKTYKGDTLDPIHQLQIDYGYVRQETEYATNSMGQEIYSHDHNLWILGDSTYYEPTIWSIDFQVIDINGEGLAGHGQEYNTNPFNSLKISMAFFRKLTELIGEYVAKYPYRFYHFFGVTEQGESWDLPSKRTRLYFTMLNKMYKELGGNWVQFEEVYKGESDPNSVFFFKCPGGAVTESRKRKYYLSREDKKIILEAYSSELKNLDEKKKRKKRRKKSKPRAAYWWGYGLHNQDYGDAGDGGGGDGKRDDEITETIEKVNGKYVVKSEKGDREFGTYDTKKEAEKRLKQIEMFKHMKEEQLDEKKKKKRKVKKKKKAGTESSKESNLGDWFKRKGAKGSKGGWVDCNAPDGKGGYKSCGRSSGEKRKKYPACRPTPGACKERGKGKSWGKKGSKRKKK